MRKESVQELIRFIEGLDRALREVDPGHGHAPAVLEIHFGFQCSKWWASLKHCGGVAAKHDESGDTLEDALNGLIGVLCFELDAIGDGLHKKLRIMHEAMIPVMPGHQLEPWGPYAN